MKGSIRGATLKVLIYADDVALLIEHADPAITVEAARQCAIDMEEILRDSLGLEISEGKQYNIVFAPGNVPAGIHGRTELLTRAA